MKEIFKEPTENISLIFSRKVLGITISEMILFFMVTSYSISFSYVTILKHYAFRTYAWDLGIYNQAFSSTLSGRLFEYNVEYYFTPTKSFFGMHFSPLMFLILSIYSILPRIETLLIIQTVAISLSAVPIYLIALKSLKNQILSLTFAFVYLVNPVTQGMNWYDFHMEVFLLH